jgi:hypothetical protein
VANHGTTFFPGVTDINQAGVIDIAPSEEITGADFTLAPLQLFHLRGHVIDSRTGLPPPQTTVMVAGSSIGFQATYMAADGTFDAGRVTPGIIF